MKTLNENIVIIASMLGGAILGLEFHYLLSVLGGIIGLFFGYMAMKTTKKDSQKNSNNDNMEVRELLEQHSKTIRKHSRELSEIKRRTALTNQH